MYKIHNIYIYIYIYIYIIYILLSNFDWKRGNLLCPVKLIVVGWWVQVGAQGTGGSMSTAQQQASRKVTRMCLTIATTFTIAWLPFQLNQLVFSYGVVAHALLVQPAAKILAYLNSCVNPVVYALMWRPFRVSLIQVGLQRKTVAYFQSGEVADLYV